MTVAATVAGAISTLAQFGFLFGGRGGERPNPIVMLGTALLAPVAAMLIQFAISRAREYVADRDGAADRGRPAGPRLRAPAHRGGRAADREPGGRTAPGDRPAVHRQPSQRPRSRQPVLDPSEHDEPRRGPRTPGGRRRARAVLRRRRPALAVAVKPAAGPATGAARPSPPASPRARSPCRRCPTCSATASRSTTRSPASPTATPPADAGHRGHDLPAARHDRGRPPGAPDQGPVGGRARLRAARDGRRPDPVPERARPRRRRPRRRGRATGTRSSRISPGSSTRSCAASRGTATPSWRRPIRAGLAERRSGSPSAGARPTGPERADRIAAAHREGAARSTSPSSRTRPAGRSGSAAPCCRPAACASPTGRAVEELAGFGEGAWWVQDAAAALPARLLAVRPGERVARPLRGARRQDGPARRGRRRA